VVADGVTVEVSEDDVLHTAAVDPDLGEAAGGAALQQK
jgi:hypothetical protein